MRTLIYVFLFEGPKTFLMSDKYKIIKILADFTEVLTMQPIKIDSSRSGLGGYNI
jgi:hypothetical protein